MSGAVASSVEKVLLIRRGLIFPQGAVAHRSGRLVRAFELDLADLGYVFSTRLSERLSQCDEAELSDLRGWCIEQLSEHLGSDRKHTPLFRDFPRGVPDDTTELWWRKVLVHFLHGAEQPCLFCGEVGSTHVLNPCSHVVCDCCFDGSNYSACPVCEHHVDTSSPFFSESPERSLPEEQVRFKWLDLGEDLDLAAEHLFVALCERTQAMSPHDRSDLDVLVEHYGLTVLAWLPDDIPVRENVAAVFGGLLRVCETPEVIPHLRRFIRTATDVLRLIAVYSGTDGSLQPETMVKEIERVEAASRFWGGVARAIGAQPPGPRLRKVYVPVTTHRFKVARLPRSLRRELLGLLEAMPYQQLAEDMLRHRSFWVWIGEFLHPHEYAKRFPQVAKAFQVVRKQDPDGNPATPFRTWYSRLEQAMSDGSTDDWVRLLSERPGEFGRRIDHVIRSAGSKEGVEVTSRAFEEAIDHLATPMLVTLHTHLSQRTTKAPVRVYWPKGRVAKGVSTRDDRALLSPEVVSALVLPIRRELLSRFSAKPRFSTAVVDVGLKNIVVPFNERTASPSAVSLPRGSRLPVAKSKTVRLFLHWCQPERGGTSTDLDLSVAFYDENWGYRDVCSYYALKVTHQDRVVAQSAGDLQDAPWPKGASEFVDVHTAPAASMGARYAVMVVNSFAGMPFSMLERGFAGVMLRDDDDGRHFDPRTVELKFALSGENGVYMPLVLDLQTGTLHWLDVQSKGHLQFNNVANASADISRICPDLITYFESGVRPAMFELGILHAAARCDRVLIRGDAVIEFSRRDDESPLDFYERLDSSEQGRVAQLTLDHPSIFAMFLRGDVNLDSDAGHSIYALFPERVTANMAASDLLV